MFNQQKPAFKFVIKSKIEPNAATDSKQDTKKDVSVASSTTTTTTSAIVSDEKKRKRTEKDATTAAPIATKKVSLDD